MRSRGMLRTERDRSSTRRDWKNSFFSSVPLRAARFSDADALRSVTLYQSHRGDNWWSLHTDDSLVRRRNSGRIRERNDSRGRDIIYRKFSLITRISVNRSCRNSDDVVNSVVHQSSTMEEFAIKGPWRIDCSAAILTETDAAVPISLPFENDDTESNVVKGRKWISTTTRGGTAETRTLNAIVMNVNVIRTIGSRDLAKDKKKNAHTYTHTYRKT